MGDGPGLDDGGRPRHKSWRSIRGMMRLMAVCAVGVWCLKGFLGVFGESREAARRAQCVNNLKSIGLALHNYHEAEGCFPPAYLAGADGKPLVSWRVLILPYLEQPPVIDESGKPRPRGWWDYRRDEPWDGPNNRTLATETPGFYSCPSHEGARGRGLTSYVAVVGPPTAFPGDESTTFAEFQDRTPETFLIVETCTTAIPWTEPRDLDWDRMSFQVDDPARPGISSEHPRGPNVLWADGQVLRLDRSSSAATVRARLTIDGGEVIPER
jgi:prepilin-type processing-associated H-X9-DG protein